MPCSPRALLLALACLVGCPSGEPPGDVPIPDDDDDTATDDDDTVVDDDDDTVVDDDDTVTSNQILVHADLPPGALLAFQDGDGAFVDLPVTGMEAVAEVTSPDGRYGLMLSCAGSTRAGVQIWLSDVTTEAEPTLVCAEAAPRGDGGGTIGGGLAGTDGLVWSLYIGTRRWPQLPGTLATYISYPPDDNYDLIAIRRDGALSANVMMIKRLLDSGGDPVVPINFTNPDDGAHEPETLTLDITETGVTSTRGVFVSRGGTVVPMGVGAGPEPAYRLISNERRFWSDLVLFGTTSTFANGCFGSSLSVVSSDELDELNTEEERHGSSVIPVAPWGPEDCGRLDAPTVSVESGLSVQWAQGDVDLMLWEGRSATGETRWTVAATPGREAATVDAAAIASLTGFEAPATGWTWTSTGYESPHPDVPASTVALLEITDLFQSLPYERTMVRLEPDEDLGRGARSHEYDEDDETRAVLVLPWPADSYAAHGVRWTGAL